MPYLDFKITKITHRTGITPRCRSKRDDLFSMNTDSARVFAGLSERAGGIGSAPTRLVISADPIGSAPEEKSAISLVLRSSCLM
jgi:hypothetical protein